MRSAAVALTIALALVAVPLAAGKGHAHHHKRADLSVSLVSSPTTVGAEGTYRLLVTNAGPAKATGVQVMFELPTGMSLVGSTKHRCASYGTFATCNLGSIGMAHARPTSIVLAAPQGAFGRVSFRVFGNRPDPDFRFNEADAVLAIQPSPAQADLGVAIQPAEPPSYAPNTPYYAVTVTNHGPGEALRTFIRYDLRSGIYATGVGSFTETISCGTAGPNDSIENTINDLGYMLALDKARTIQFCVPRLAAGESETFQIAIGAVIRWGDVLPWTARVDALTPDPDLSNNIAGGPASP